MLRKLEVAIAIAWILSSNYILLCREAFWSFLPILWFSWHHKNTLPIYTYGLFRIVDFAWKIETYTIPVSKLIFKKVPSNVSKLIFKKVPCFKMSDFSFKSCIFCPFWHMRYGHWRWSCRPRQHTPTVPPTCHDICTANYRFHGLVLN